MKNKAKTVADVMARKAKVEVIARTTDYDQDLPGQDPSFEAGRFRGYLDALRWVLGENGSSEDGKVKILLCQDMATCPFGEECYGQWNSHDPQTGRLCRDSLKRNFAWETGRVHGGQGHGKEEKTPPDPPDGTPFDGLSGCEHLTKEQAEKMVAGSPVKDHATRIKEAEPEEKAKEERANDSEIPF